MSSYGDFIVNSNFRFKYGNTTYDAGNGILVSSDGSSKIESLGTDTPDDVLEVVSATNLKKIGRIFSGAPNRDGSHYTLTGLENININEIEDKSLEAVFMHKAGPVFGLENWDITNVTNLTYAFEGFGGYDNLTLNLENWNTSNITDLSRTFHNCYSNILISNWDVSNVKRLDTTFDHRQLSYYIWPDLSKWDVSNVEIFYSTFRGILSPTNTTPIGIGLENWNVCKATNMSLMFADNGTLDLDLSAWTVPLIASKPTDFNSNTTFENSKQPQWGAPCNWTPRLTIDSATITGPYTVCRGRDVARFEVTFTGNADDVEYLWETTDVTAEFVGELSATPTITFNTAGAHTVTCTLTSATATDSPVVETFDVTAEDCAVDASGAYFAVQRGDTLYSCKGEYLASTLQDGDIMMLQRGGIDYKWVISDSNSSTGNPAPSARWETVTYGDDKFVALGYGGSIPLMYSSDGVSWTTAESPRSSWTGIVYGNNKFCAVNFNNSTQGAVSAVSDNGIDWIFGDPTGVKSFTAVMYDGEKFVATASSDYHKIHTSIDGLNWNAVEAPVGCHSITYGNNTYVAVSSSPNTKRSSVMYSNDALNWTVATSAPTNNGFFDVYYADNKFVAVGQTNFAVSNDGINWNSFVSPDSNQSWSSVTYGNGVWVAVASLGWKSPLTSRIVVSSDGINWSRAEDPFGDLSEDEDPRNYMCVTYSNGRFVAVKFDGIVGSVYSSDGMNWKYPDPA